MPTVTKLFRVVTYCKEFQPANLYDPSVRWSCEAMQQIKYIISPHTEDRWRPDQAR